MPSHHNLARLFEVLNESSSRFFHDLQVQQNASLLHQSARALLNRSSMGNIDSSGVPQNQLSGPIWHRGCSLDLVFRLVMFFNSLPGYSSKQKPIVEMRSFER